MTTSTAVTAVKAYWMSGIGHCNSAEIIHHYLTTNNIQRSDSTWVALQSIIGFGAENALKAYLASADMTRDALLKKPFGHNLRNLLNEAKVRGLNAYAVDSGRPQLITELEKFISLCGDDYQSFNYRYIEGDGVTLLGAGSSTDNVIRCLQHLLNIVESKAGLSF
ncbi:hypothetical protein GOA69_16235 [Sinorhizobium meliloti]|uniref:hypothetical protein n=1 Tax=Rhizobium meliloti TaxID=382 RepID=UPI00299CFC6B|nr:hypothetical protein [Sinorhizobium meliloti]